MLGRRNNRNRGRERERPDTHTRPHRPVKPPPQKPPKIPKRSIIPELFDIPRSAIMGVAHIEMAGNREAVIDGIQGVLEYDENIIRLSTMKMIIKFTGRYLQIKALSHDSAVVSGHITSVEFIT